MAAYVSRYSPDLPLRILLLSKSVVPARTGAWSRATAPWALGALSLRTYVETLPALASRVRIEVRSYPADAPFELMLTDVKALSPDILGFTCQPWNHAEHVRLGALVKRLFPGTTVWHGGPMVVDRARYLADAGRGSVDVAVQGEGEQPFAELIANRLDGAPALPDIKGIAWFDDDGAVQSTGARETPDVSRLPPVMTEASLEAMGPFVTYETTRGCPFRCSFCNWGGNKAKLRARDRAVIEQDLRAILARPEVTHLWFTDAGLDVSVDHVTFLADCVRRHRKHPVVVSGYMFLAHQDLGYVSRLVGGIDGLQLGLQTAHEDVLHELGRGSLSAKRFDRMLEAVMPHYPGLSVDLIYGLPGVRLRELQSSVRFLLDKGVSFINVFHLAAIPGTDMMSVGDARGLVADEEYPFNVFANEGCTAADLLEMQQFKVNLDTLRPLFVGGTWAAAKAAGVDLVAFADRLHELVPRFNFRIEYGVEMVRDLDAELIDALHDAVDRWTEVPAQRDFLHSLLERSRTRSAASPEPARAPSPPAEGPPVPPAAPDRPIAPSAALRGLWVALSSAVGGFGTAITPSRARDAWREHEADGPRREPLGVHVHVPFCAAICTYCDCATDALQAPAQVERYLEALEREMAYFEGVAARPVDRLYVGGGTPNLLGEAQIERLLGLVNRFHRFAPDAVRCFECHPGHSTRGKLDVAAALGVNRVSYGVQSRDPRVLKRVNRGGQTDADVERAVRDAFEAGIREVNLDFIYSLGDETPDSLLDGIVWALSLKPTTVCLQLLNDSHYAAPYRDAAHRERVATEFRALAVRLAEWVADRAPAYECSFRPDTVVVHRRDMWRDWRRTLEYYAARDPTCLSTLGYGRHAQSRLFGRLAYQNQERGGRFEPDAAQYSARPVTPALEALVDLVAGLEHARVVQVARLRETHGDAVMEALAQHLSRLERAGHVEHVGDVIRDAGLTPEGVAWLARQVAPAAMEAATPPPAGSICVTGRDATWRIRLEPERPRAKYFAVVHGVGLYYQTDPAKLPEPAIVQRVMAATVRHAERLLEGGCPEPELAARIAGILDHRLVEAKLGLRAKVESSQPKVRRLTTVAPS